MSSRDELECPATGCSFEGSVSQVIHHITDQDDAGHNWDALGFDHSYQFRQHVKNRSETNREAESPSDIEAKDANSSPSLESVPGIGDARGEALRAAGYETAEDVAAASHEELSEVSGIANPTARCIRTTAREVCEYSDTFVTRLADSLNGNREAVANAYEDLGSMGIPPEQARETLEILFSNETDRSLVSHLTDYPLYYRHFLRETGFDSIDDVASASIDELSEASYVHEAVAEGIRETARDIRDEEPDATDRGSDRDVGSEVGDRAESSADQGTTASGPDNETSADEEGSSPSARNEGTVESDDGDEDVQKEPESTTIERDDQERPSETEVTVSDGTFPKTLKRNDQWLLWSETDDGRKVPRAPWETGDSLTYVSAMDPSNWVSFTEATQWRSKLPHDLELAYVLTRDDDIVFLDLDDVTVDGELSSAARSLIESAGSYTAISTSGSGVHVFLRGSLPEGVKSLTGPIDETGDQTIEIYDRNRFVAVTGDHLAGTETNITSGESLLDELEDELASVGTETPDRTITEPRRSRDELRDIETTDDIQDVFDAVHQVRPSDIKMRSTKTGERSDGTYSYDPSWTQSDSGTRLAVLDDGWIYRKGMIALDALQLVALEEGILSDERTYPSGKDFWDAIESLRDRGAHIPRFEPDNEPPTQASTQVDDTEPDRREVAKRINYGESVRTNVHPYDRDYQESLALDLAPVLVEAAEQLDLTAGVTYRAAELYAKGHKAGVVPGASHETSLGAALRIATIEAEAPRPLEDIADAVEEDQSSIRSKFQQMIQKTDLGETLDATDIVVDPIDYVPYVARQLDVANDTDLCEDVRELIDSADTDGGSNPISEAAAAFYVAMKQSDDHSARQKNIAYATGLSTVTIRNNYGKFAE